MTIHLGRSLPNASRNLPEQQRGDASAANRGCPYSVLLPVGFTMPPQLPLERCALTAPFHPYLSAEANRRFAFCGTFPRVTPAGHYPAPYPRGARTFLEKHLSDSFPRSSNRLAERTLYKLEHRGNTLPCFIICNAINKARAVMALEGRNGGRHIRNIIANVMQRAADSSLGYGPC